MAKYQDGPEISERAIDDTPKFMNGPEVAKVPPDLTSAEVAYINTTNEKPIQEIIPKKPEKEVMVAKEKKPIKKKKGGKYG